MAIDRVELDELVTKLRRRAARLHEEVAGKQHGAVALESPGIDRERDNDDMSFVISEAEVETGEAERDEVEIAAIERTLQRIEDGNYGTCVQCGVDIPPARMKAQPLAVRCVPCQNAREKVRQRR